MRMIKEYCKKCYKKRKNEQGFTLVEMIVVLVIIAVLAAITIPALLKYIDKAKDKQVLIDTRSICMAVQSVMAETYATDEWNIYGNYNGYVNIDKYYVAWKSGNDAQKSRYQEIVDLAGITSLNNGGSFGAFVDNQGVVSMLVYRNGSGKVVFYFRETGQYNVYDESDFSSLDSYMNGSLKDRVFYLSYYKDSTGEINMYINRNQITASTGYQKGTL